MSCLSLPHDAATLHTLVQAQQIQLAERNAEIEHLKLVIAKLRRLHFGQSAERREGDAAQLQLTLDQLAAAQADPAATPAPNTTGSETPSKRRRPRKPLPPELPRETIRHEPGHTDCPDCGGRLRPLGEDIAEMLEYVPAHFKVIRHVRPKLACCRCDSIVQAPAPSRPIERGLASPPSCCALWWRL